MVTWAISLRWLLTEKDVGGARRMVARSRLGGVIGHVAGCLVYGVVDGVRGKGAKCLFVSTIYKKWEYN